ncbi:MAG: hypothetical protein Q9160_005913 [Pyrenula sp. 1 TL-2023]
MLFSVSDIKDGIPPHATKFGARVMRPEEVDQTCGLHPDPKSIKDSERFSLSWLRACRRLYKEARFIAYSRITLHVCDPATLANIRQQIPRSARRLFSSVELGLKLTTRPGWRAEEGAFLYPFTWPIGHNTAGSNGYCHCPSCFFGSDRLELASFFPSLKDLFLKIYFQCEGKGRLYNGEVRAYNGTYRPKNPLPLECTLHPYNSGVIANQVHTITDFFSHKGVGNELQRVNARFLTQNIEHDDTVSYDVPEDCWCKGLAIDKERLENSGLSAKVEICLLNNLDPLVEYYPGWRDRLIG